MLFSKEIHGTLKSMRISMEYNNIIKNNMENKYYTPEIEEFHIGFEFEYENKLLEQWRQEKLSLVTPWGWETIGLRI